MSYVMEQGVPLPAASRNPGAGPKGPMTPLTRTLDAMEVMQSFMVGDYSEYQRAMQFALRSRPKRFAFRKREGGWRIWRTE